MSTTEEQVQQQHEAPETRLQMSRVVAPEDAGFNLEAELAAAPDHEVGTQVQIKDLKGRLRYFVRDGKTLPVTVTVLSKHSALAQKVDKELRGQRIRGAMTREKLYKEQLYKLARCTTGWDGFVDNNLQPLPFRWQSVEKLYLANSHVRLDALEVMEEGEAEDFSEAS